MLSKQQLTTPPFLELLLKSDLSETYFLAAKPRGILCFRNRMPLPGTISNSVSAEDISRPGIFLTWRKRVRDLPFLTRLRSMTPSTKDSIVSLASSGIDPLVEVNMNLPPLFLTLAAITCRKFTQSLAWAELKIGVTESSSTVVGPFVLSSILVT